MIELLYGFNPSLISLRYDFFSPLPPLLRCTQFNFSAFNLFGFMEAFGTFPMNATLIFRNEFLKTGTLVTF